MLHKSRFGRRLTALGDSPAACATLGINQTTTKLAVFALSAALAGFAGALLGVFQATATVQDFQMLAGLGYLLLLVVGGVAVVSGAVMGGILFQSFGWLTTQFPNFTPLSWFARVGPGLAGIGIGRQPSGVIPTVGEEVRHQIAPRLDFLEAYTTFDPAQYEKFLTAKPTYQVGMTVHEGREGFADVARYGRILYPNGQERRILHHVIAEGDVVSVLMTVHAVTNNGSRYENIYSVIYELDDGLIAKQFEILDFRVSADKFDLSALA